MAKSIAETSVKLTADASQFVAEFQRADNQARRSSASIDSGVDELLGKLKRKFSVADLGKDLLKGAGLFGGLEIGKQGAELITGYFKEAAEEAKSIEESTKKQLEYTMQLVALRQTDEQRLQKMTEDQQRDARDLEKLQNKKANPDGAARAAFGIGNEGDDGKLTSEELAKQDELTESLGRRGIEIEKLAAKFRDGKVNNALTDFFQSIDEQSANSAILVKKNIDEMLAAAKKNGPDEADLKEITPEDRARVAAIEKQINDELYNQAQAFNQIVDPATKYRQQLDEINQLQAAGVYTTAQAADAVAALTREFQHTQEVLVDSALKDFFGQMDEEAKQGIKTARKYAAEIQHIVDVTGDGITNAFVDAANGVSGAWKNLADTIIKELERVVVQALIVKPLLNSLGGAIGGGGFFGGVGSALSNYGNYALGGAGAVGSAVDAGVTYRVNEAGEEFFKSNVGGTIVPAGISSTMAKKGSGGGTQVFIDATGADAAAIQRLEANLRTVNTSIERRSVAAVIAQKKKGGQLAGALR